MIVIFQAEDMNSESGKATIIIRDSSVENAKGIVKDYLGSVDRMDLYEEMSQDPIITNIHPEIVYRNIEKKK